jgi:hypothetical protein
MPCAKSALVAPSSEARTGVTAIQNCWLPPFLHQLDFDLPVEVRQMEEVGGLLQLDRWERDRSRVGLVGKAPHQCLGLQCPFFSIFLRVKGPWPEDPHRGFLGQTHGEVRPQAEIGFNKNLIVHEEEGVERDRVVPLLFPACELHAGA